MQAIDKITNFEYWITLVMLFLFVIVFFLKAINAQLLKQHFGLLLQVPFSELEDNENFGNTNSYKALLFSFFIITFSVYLYKLNGFLNENTENGFVVFGKFFLGALAYFVTKRLLEFLFSNLFLIKNQIKIFIDSKWNYLFSLSFFLYIALIFHEYAKTKLIYVFYFALLLFLVRFLFILITNKNLILSKLFYFILYICAFEIAPLFVLFKLMF